MLSATRRVDGEETDHGRRRMEDGLTFGQIGYLATALSGN